MEGVLGYKIDHYLAIGGGAHSSLWRQMIADISGKPVLISPTVEASALGAGMIAAHGAGWYTSITDAAEAMCGETTVIEPDASRFDRYRELLAIYRQLYHATAQLNASMVDFAASEPS